MRAIALLMFVAATIPMAFLQPIIGLLLWILFSYMNPHRIAYGFAMGFPWVMITALVTMISTSSHADQRQPIVMTPIMVMMTLFLVWTAITTLFAVKSGLAVAELIRFFKILLMAYFTTMLVLNRRHMHWVLWTIVLSFGFWGFKGGLFTLLSGGGYHVLGPPKSFFYDNNDFALVLCMTIPLMRYLQLHDERVWVRRALWILIGLSVVAVIGTYSRGGFLALSAVAFMLILKSRRRAGLLAVMPILAIAIGAFMPAQYYERLHTINDYQDNKSATGRIDSWKFATNLALARPILGGGFRAWASDDLWNRYGPPGARHRAVHSIFFDVLCEHGFVGLGLFLSLLLVGWASLARVRKRARAGPPEVAWISDLASMLQVSMVGFAAAGTFLPMPYFDLFYQMLAILAVLQVLLVRELKAHEARDTQKIATPAATTRTPRPATAPAGRRRRGAQRPDHAGGPQGLPWW